MSQNRLSITAQSLAENISYRLRRMLQPETRVEEDLPALRGAYSLLEAEEAEVLKANPDLKIDCKAGCSWCCHRPVAANILEVAAAVDHVNKNFDDAQKVALGDRLDIYETKVEKYRQGLATMCRLVCPFLVDNLCSIYESRPLACRGAVSSDVRICEFNAKFPEHQLPQAAVPQMSELPYAASGGLSGAMHQSGKPYDYLDFGGSVKRFLEEPEINWYHRVGEMPRFDESDKTMTFTPINDEPHGFAFDDEINREYLAIVATGDMPKAIALVEHEERPTNLLSKLRVPNVYSSEEEIDYWRTRFSDGVEELLNTDFDPVAFYNALALHDTFGLAYQGRSVRKLLERHGELLVNKVARKAVPEFSDPQEGLRKPGRFRLGYLSENIRQNNGGRWALGWVKNHSPDIETFIFNIGVAEDSMSLAFKEHADHYYHAVGSVHKIAAMIRDLDLDAMIYTDLGMTGRNYQFAVLKLAHVQCTAWGHPVTSGLPTVDYYLSSDLMEPEDAQDEYTEKLVRLPRSGLCYLPIAFPKVERTREDFGLPEGFLPAMLQNLIKWHPSRDQLLRVIAQKAKVDIPALAIPQEFERNVFAERMKKGRVPIKILNRVGPREFNQLTSLIDVSFDPPEWSGGNTTIEAMEKGIPVITLPGKYMRGRHSYAFLKIAGADGLIAKDEDDFVDLILDRDRQREAMRHVDSNALFNDLHVVEALDRFLLGTQR